jgi:ankyrin repeat protein
VLGIRAIHGAANRGANQIIRYLVEQGADLDAADNEKRTPLVWAQGVFLATHPPEKKPETMALLQELQARRVLMSPRVPKKHQSSMHERQETAR